MLLRRRHSSATPDDTVAELLERLLDSDFDDVDTGDWPPRIASALTRLRDRLCAAPSAQREARMNALGESAASHQITALQHHIASAAEVSQSLSEEARALLTGVMDRLDNARTSLAASEVQSREQLENVRKSLRSMPERLHDELGEVETALGDKVRDAQSVLGAIEEIGNGLKVLSINARIEAARAGEERSGFAVVAQEVRDLAIEATEKTQQVEATLDFKSVNAAMARSHTRNAEMVSELSDLTNEVMEGMRAIVTTLQKQLDDIAATSAVLVETAALSQGAVARIIDKSTRASSLSTDLMHAQVDAVDASDEAFGTTLNALLARHQLDPSRSADRLDRILERGTLRIAIEPNFVGLSFRAEEDGELIGLDAQYARALARWLEVDVEFIETPWDTITEMLHIPERQGEECADIVLSALPPSPTYFDVAYSETYTHLEWVLARRSGDQRIHGLSDLTGRVLGIINDPGAFEVLRARDVSWGGEERRSIHLANLIAYTDQSKLHDALADGVVDAFAVDLPIYYWACTSPQSPWYGRIELLPGNIPDDPYYYTIAVARDWASYRLLQRINAFIAWFKERDERRALEVQWQGRVVPGELSYRDEPGDLSGEAELGALYAHHRRRMQRLAK